MLEHKKRMVRNICKPFGLLPNRVSHGRVIGLGIGITAVLSLPALAQELPPIPPGSLEPPRPLQQPPELSNPPAFPLPSPEPSAPPLPSIAPPRHEVLLRRVDVLGSTVFSAEELAALAARLIDQRVSFEEILAIRTAITNYYTDRGYTTSGAFLPPQDIQEGRIIIQVVEGELEQIEVRGLQRLNSDYVASRIALAGRRPVNLRALETALQLLQADPLLASVQAELTPGSTPGRSVLILSLQEADTLQASVTTSNRNSPSVGSETLSLNVAELNLLGLGDRLQADFERTAGLTAYTLSYELPLTPSEGRLSVRYSRSNSQIIEPPFSPLDINSPSETYSLSFRHPLLRTPTSEFTVGIGVDLRRSQTFLLGNLPFSFSVGPDNGRSALTIIRFNQDWIHRSPDRVLAVRSQVNWGVGLLDATVNNTGTDGRFLSWVGQFQWVQSLGPDTLAIFRFGTQLTGNSLLPLEQFSIGGLDTVRGYRQNQRVGDNGMLGSVELRLPVLRDPEGWGLVQVIPFLDVGTVWNSSPVPIANATLSSVGLGLRWQFSPLAEARLDWGIPLNRSGTGGSTWQDAGVYFSIQVRPF